MIDTVHDPATREKGLYPIRTVSAMTGVHAVTLRAWERRYHLIQPMRTSKGHRLYTLDDIEHIKRVTQLLDQGIAISQVRPLLQQQATVDPTEIVADNNNDAWQRYQARMLAAIEQFDQHRLDSIYNDALSLYPIDTVSRRLILPILEVLGGRWQQHPAGVASEHFFSVFLRNKLGARIQHLITDTHGPLLFVACLPGEQHETGMLLFALAALSHGYRTLILGADLPLDQIPPVFARRPCDAIVISGFSEPRAAVMSTQLPMLVQQVAVPVFIGGRFVEACREEIQRTGAIALGADLHDGLSQIHQTLRVR